MVIYRRCAAKTCGHQHTHVKAMVIQAAHITFTGEVRHDLALTSAHMPCMDMNR